MAVTIAISSVFMRQYMFNHVSASLGMCRGRAANSGTWEWVGQAACRWWEVGPPVEGPVEGAASIEPL